MGFNEDFKRAARLVCLVLMFCSVAAAQDDVAAVQDDKKDTRPGIAPDIREDELPLKVQKGNFVIVPIPIANPTLGEGLVAGAAYFYAQTEEEKKIQPASLTALGGLYTSNNSRALVLAQQNYWNKNNWRFTGAVGAADLRLSVLAPDETSSGQSLDWRIKGEFLYAKIARKIAGHWYGGLFTRGISANQTFETDTFSSDLETESDLSSVGLGAVFEYDSRDMPMNSYTGRHFKFDALFNDEAIGSDATYQSYGTVFRSYHELTDSLVLAWEIQGCQRSGPAPLWDACKVKLRGFSATDYLGQASASSQAEARWRLSKRWGLVGFAGVGTVVRSFSEDRDREPIPSYGIGVRFSVLPAKRINLRVDFARSLDSDAVHVSVGEAF
jgi:hypothetical protein